MFAVFEVSSTGHPFDPELETESRSDAIAHARFKAQDGRTMRVTELREGGLDFSQGFEVFDSREAE